MACFSLGCNLLLALHAMQVVMPFIIILGVGGFHRPAASCFGLNGVEWHNRDIASIGAISQQFSHRYRPSIPPTATPFRHLGSLGENFLVNNCGMYDSF